MRKKDVITLLLTCGLAVSGNGMPVLAAGLETDVPTAAQVLFRLTSGYNVNIIKVQKQIQENVHF